MADLKYLPPEPTLPELPGGRTRPSVYVDLSNLPAVARRRELNERLLDGTCAFSDAPTEPRFTEEDLQLLLLATRERFGGEAAVVRRQAVLALGGIYADDAVRRLVDLATTVVEHDGIRIAALGALPPERRSELLEALTDDPSPAVADHVRRLREGTTSERRSMPTQVPLDPELGADGSCGCKKCC